MRKLVTVRQVKEKSAIKGADRIEVLKVDGWKVVSKKDQFQVGDYGVFFEIDSLLPVNDSRYDFLPKHNTKNYDGIECIRISTVRLRGEISQGLFLPLDQFPEVNEYSQTHNMSIQDVKEAKVDFAETLGVQKYEINLSVRGNDAAGSFPFYIPKTDQERINNVYDELVEDYKNIQFFATLKMNGASLTAYYTKVEEQQYSTLDVDKDGGQFIVCSRSNTLKPTENPYTVACNNLGVENKLKAYNENHNTQYALQGELLGKGIQGTSEKFLEYTVRFFSVFDVIEQKYIPFGKSLDVLEEMGLPSVNVLDVMYPFIDLENVDDFVEYANNIESPHSDTPEGVVFHSVDTPVCSFKVISPKFLLKYE